MPLFKWAMVSKLNLPYTSSRFVHILLDSMNVCWDKLRVEFVFYVFVLLLQGAVLFGKRLEVNFSKHPNITPGTDSHDYVNSNLNRFNRNAAKNYRYCCSPTKMIHLSTLPQDVTEEEVVNHVREHGEIVNTKVFEMNGKKQALVQFENEEEAAEALVCKHATSLGGSMIRISFSQLQTI